MKTRYRSQELGSQSRFVQFRLGIGIILDQEGHLTELKTWSSLLITSMVEMTSQVVMVGGFLNKTILGQNMGIEDTCTYSICNKKKN